MTERNYSIKHGSNTPIRVNGRECGYVRGGIFYRKFDPERHVLRHPAPSLALALEAVEQIKAAGAERMMFFTDAGEAYTCTLAHFCEFGRAVDFGYGRQLALPLTGFSVTRTGKAIQMALPWGMRT